MCRGDFGRLGHGDCNDVFIPRPIAAFTGMEMFISTPEATGHAILTGTHTERYLTLMTTTQPYQVF